MTKEELVDNVVAEIAALSVEDAFIVGNLLTPENNVPEEHMDLWLYYINRKSEAANDVVESINLVALVIPEEEKRDYYYAMQQGAFGRVEFIRDEERVARLN